MSGIETATSVNSKASKNLKIPPPITFPNFLYNSLPNLTITCEPAVPFNYCIEQEGKKNKGAKEARRMASINIGTSLACASQNKGMLQRPGPAAFFNPLSARLSKAAMSVKPKTVPRVQVEASLKEKVVTWLPTAALTASVMIPEVAEAAAPGVLTPSLQNFLLSIAAGGGVLVVAVIGVLNFDSVKRT